ncbi:hypothetical protein O1L60_42715 [Streptomyces diastatochromogenes]|nr:hypothetical protein [Streptomyces diastatochromogenes]
MPRSESRTAPAPRSSAPPAPELSHVHEPVLVATRGDERIDRDVLDHDVFGCDVLGCALSRGALLQFLRRAGLAPDDVRPDDAPLSKWRGGPAV